MVSNLSLRVQVGTRGFALVVNNDDANSEYAEFGSVSRYTDTRTNISYCAFWEDPDLQPEVFRMEPLTLPMDAIEEVDFPPDIEEPDEEETEEDEEGDEGDDLEDIDDEADDADDDEQVAGPSSS